VWCHCALVAAGLPGIECLIGGMPDSLFTYVCVILLINVA